MTTYVSTDTKTQALPRVPTAVVAVSEEAEAVAPVPVEAMQEESVQHLYEAGMAKLDALHDRWVAGTADIRDAQAMNAPEPAAA